jgi:hypothetical protein
MIRDEGSARESPPQPVHGPRGHRRRPPRHHPGGLRRRRPYSGTWTGDKGEGAFTVKIQKANDGWWKLDVTPEDIQTYGAEIDGELQTMNGGSSFKRSGDSLEFTVASEKSGPAILTRQ